MNTTMYAFLWAYLCYLAFILLSGSDRWTLAMALMVQRRVAVRLPLLGGTDPKGFSDTNNGPTTVQPDGCLYQAYAAGSFLLPVLSQRVWPST